MNTVALASGSLPGSPVRSEMAALLPMLSARALRLARTRADADDLVQETMVRALRFEATFVPGTNLRAWMHQILQSVFISRMRRRVRERRALERYAHDPVLSSASTAPAPVSAVSDKVDAALRSLPDKFLKVVELVDLGDLSYREAADELGVPVGTVMSRLFRARRLLEGALGQEAPAIANAA